VVYVLYCSVLPAVSAIAKGARQRFL